MIEYQDKYIYIWKLAGDNAILMRVFGRTPQVIIPANIGEHKIVSIGKYCFSEKEQLSDNLSSDKEQAFMDKSMRPLCGSYIDTVVIPDTVNKIDNCAFYGCSGLCLIECGKELTETGSDAFLNCTSLKNIVIRGSVDERSGARSMLSQISSDVEVTFKDKDVINGELFFPEFYEGYDEIGPAHIFGLNIEGEGFRARKCFKDGIMDLEQYDSIFAKASIEENERTLSRMALGRVQYPAGLSDRYKNAYQDHIKKNGNAIVKKLIDSKELITIQFLCKNKLLLMEDVENAVGYAADRSWAEGAASLLKWKNEFYGSKKKTSYDFDPF